MKKILLATAAFGITLAAATTASANPLDDVTISASADYVSEYVFRGVSFANTSVQPGIEASYGNFTVGTWASVAIGETSALAGDEIDIYASYGRDLTEKLSGSVGATLYHFPQSGSLFNLDSEELGSTFEAYASLAYDTILAPSVTGYYDFTLDAFTVEGSVSHSIPLVEKTSLDLGVTGGFVSVDGDGDYEWATATASLGYAFSDAASFYVGANFSVNSEDLLDFVTFGDIEDAGDLDVPLQSDDTLFWVGTGFSVGF